MSIMRKGVSLRHELDRVFNDWFGAELPNGSNGTSVWAPAVDIREDEKSIFIDAELPGLKREEISVEVENGILSLRGEHKAEKKEKQGNYVCMERSYGSFYRSFSLPGNVKTETIDAKFEDGVLHLTLPKLAGAKPNRVAVK